ncbi:hypothetical protein HK104_003167, partial [Borealophlyctis nickersoniae]
SLPENRESLSQPVQTLLKNYPSVINLAVQWGEQDAYGHLNNCIYPRYFESARIAYFDHILAPHLSRTAYTSFIRARGVGPILKSTTVNYRRPVTYPDTVSVGVRVPREKVGKDRFTQEFVIVSHKEEKVVCDGECVVVTFDYKTGKKADIPKEVLEAFEIGEGRVAGNSEGATSGDQVK